MKAMTPKITDLTDEEINVLIAEAIGWKRIGPDNPCSVWPMPEYVTGEHGTAMMSPQSSTVATHPPDYCNDLNAMHEAEKTLTDKQYEQFFCNLLRVSGGDKMRGIAGCRATESSTAKQRAQAFLLAVGRAVQ